MGRPRTGRGGTDSKGQAFPLLVSGWLDLQGHEDGEGASGVVLPEAVEALNAHRVRQAEERLRYAGIWEDESLVFPSATGRLMRWPDLVKRHFKPVPKKSGTRRIRFYDLRHTFATLMLEQGEHPKVVQEILGHASISQTMNTYSHVTPTMQQAAFARLGERLK